MDEQQKEIDQTKPGELFYAAGKVYRKLPDGTVEWLGYQFVGAEPERDA